MVTERFLIDYLPPFMREYLEMKEIMKTEQAEIDGLWEKCELALVNQFILDATEYGVKRWESMLKIHPKDTDTLDERKFRILARLNQELPYTIRKLREVLTTMCGADGFFLDLQPNQYHIEVKLALTNKNNYQDVENLLTQMIPANLTQAVKIMYNTHEVLAQYTHRYLSAFTQSELKNEVLTNA